MAKVRARAEVRIKPSVVPEVVVQAAYTDERLQNLGASKRDREMVARGIATGVISRVSAYSISARDGQTRDEMRLDFNHDKRTAGRRMEVDLSGQRSITEQIDRADAAQFEHQIGRFQRRGRSTEVEISYTRDVYQDPERYADVSKAMGTKSVTNDRQWKGGGYRQQSRITPGAFNGALSVSDNTYRRRK